MPRILKQVTQQVSLELSHVSGGEGRRAQLRVIDGPSNLTILEVDIPPEVFYRLLASQVDGTLLPAKMISANGYTRVGRTRHYWTRRIGNGVTEEAAGSWAAALAERYGMQEWSVRNRQGGLHAEWELWAKNLDEETREILDKAVAETPLPEGAR